MLRITDHKKRQDEKKAPPENPGNVCTKTCIANNIHYTNPFQRRNPALPNNTTLIKIIPAGV